MCLVEQKKKKGKKFLLIDILPYIKIELMLANSFPFRKDKNTFNTHTETLYHCSIFYFSFVPTPTPTLMEFVLVQYFPINTTKTIMGKRFLGLHVSSLVLHSRCFDLISWESFNGVERVFCLTFKEKLMIFCSIHVWRLRKLFSPAQRR